MSEDISFEAAYARLETILEQLNGNEVSLEDSLSLYEEADTLIRKCNQKLSTAEEKVQMLIKKRGGDLILNEDQTPQLESFNPQNEDEVFSSKPSHVS